MAFAAAGCGGGQDEGQGGQGDDGGNAGATETTKDGGSKPEAGAGIQNFAVDVVSAQQARITATLERPAALELRVRREMGDNTTKVGKVSFGRRPQGPLTINWNLRVAGKPLTPGSYQLVLRGGEAVKSERVQVTVPG